MEVGWKVVVEKVRTNDEDVHAAGNDGDASVVANEGVVLR